MPIINLAAVDTGVKVRRDDEPEEEDPYARGVQLWS